MRNHMKYGHNMKDLYNPYTQKINLAPYFRGKNVKTAYDPDQFSVGTATVYWDQWQSFFFGWTLSLQYSNQTVSDCFYAVVDSLDSLDYVVQDAQNFFTTYNYYDLLVYDPLHIYANFMASFE